MVNLQDAAGEEAEWPKAGPLRHSRASQRCGAAIDGMLAGFATDGRSHGAGGVLQHSLAPGVRALAEKIVPKLVVTHRMPMIAAPQHRDAAVTDAELTAFAEALIADDSETCRAGIEALVARGATFDSLCLDLVARAARRLGEMWEEDLCGFFDVTAGLATLHSLLHHMSERFAAAAPVPASTRRVLLASLPNEQHSLGLQMVAEMFRRSGWDVVLAPVTAEAELVSIVSSGRFAIAGLSVADQRRGRAVSHVIQSIRRCSANPLIGILLGGPVFAANPDLACTLGADAYAGDAREAVARAEALRTLMPALDMASPGGAHSEH